MDDSADESMLSPHCCACLGILEPETITKGSKEVVRQFEKLDYDCKTFRVGISIPQCVTIRHSAVMVYMSERGQNMN